MPDSVEFLKGMDLRRVMREDSELGNGGGDANVGERNVGDDMTAGGGSCWTSGGSADRAWIGDLLMGNASPGELSRACNSLLTLGEELGGGEMEGAGGGDEGDRSARGALCRSLGRRRGEVVWDGTRGRRVGASECWRLLLVVGLLAGTLGSGGGGENNGFIDRIPRLPAMVSNVSFQRYES